MNSILLSILIFSFPSLDQSAEPPRYIQILAEKLNSGAEAQNKSGLDQSVALDPSVRKLVESQLKVLEAHRTQPKVALQKSMELAIEGCNELPKIDSRLNAKDIEECREFNRKSVADMADLDTPVAKMMVEMMIRTHRGMLDGETLRNQQNAMIDQTVDFIFQGSETTPEERAVIEKIRASAKDSKTQDLIHEGREDEAIRRQMEVWQFMLDDPAKDKD